MKRYLFTIAAVSTSVFASKDLPIKAAAHINGALMATPPLAGTFQKKTWSLSIRPAYFGVDQEATDQDPKNLSYSGVGGSIFFNYPLNKSLELYGLVFGNQIAGDFSGPGRNNSTVYPIIAKDVKANTQQVAFGLSYDPFAGSDFALPIFFGPGIVNTKLTETILTTEPTEQDDFDLRMNTSATIIYGGFQAAWKAHKYISLGIFGVGSQYIDDGQKCQTYDVTVRSYGFFFDLSDPACMDGQNSSTSRIEYDLSLYSFGVTVGIPEWGLSLVAFSEVSKTKYFEGVQLDMYQITLTL